MFHQYTIRTEKRDELAAYMRDNDVGTGIYYPIPIHKQPLYRELGYEDHLSECEKASEEVLSLPVHPAVEENDLNRMIDIIGNWS